MNNMFRQEIRLCVRRRGSRFSGKVWTRATEVQTPGTCGSEGHNQLPVLPIVEPTSNVQQFRVPPKAQRKVFSGLPAESVLRRTILLVIIRRNWSRSL